MKTVVWLAFFEALILAGILWLNPVWSKIGVVVPPDTGGIGETAFTPPPVPKGIPKAKTAADLMLNYSQYANSPSQQLQNNQATFLDAVELRVLELTNAERRKKRLKPLQPEDSLQTAARAHSLDMLVRQFFDHANPNGQTPHDRIAIVHRRLIGTTGENIWMQEGWDFSQVDELAKQAVEGWMNSPGHRENILRKEYTHLGVGGVGKAGKVWLTQNFASIQAFLKQPLNLELKSGDRLDLATRRVSRRRSPVKYAFWLPEKGILAADPLPTSDNQVKNIKPGEYRLRFYFPERGRYLIYPGPQVVVK